MTQLEHHFLEVAPRALNDIANALDNIANSLARIEQNINELKSVNNKSN